MRNRNYQNKRSLPSNADDKGELVLRGHVEVAVLLRLLLHADLVALLRAVLRDVLLSTLEDERLLSIAGLGNMRKWLGRVTGNRAQTQTTAYLAELDGRLQTSGLLRLPPLALLQNRLRDGGQLARGLSGGGGCWLGLTVVMVVVVVVGKREKALDRQLSPPAAALHSLQDRFGVRLSPGQATRGG